jgi:hypothetical protein
MLVVKGTPSGKQLKQIQVWMLEGQNLSYFLFE